MIKQALEQVKNFQKSGLNTRENIFSLEQFQSPAALNVEFNNDFSISKRLGTTTMNTVAMNSGGFAGYGMFDFGVGASPQARRLILASNTGLYYSVDVGKNWVVCDTGQADYLHSFAFVKNYVVACDDSYSTFPRYWAGSAGSYFEKVSTAVPICKYPIAHQGYFFLLNEVNNERRVNYIDENSMFDEVFSNFQLPSERNDEITGGFVLGRYLYVSTKSKIFRLGFVGGNPDWDYVEVKNWGFVPRTMKKVDIPNVGEVVIGLDWSKQIRIFDGSDSEYISEIIQKNNGITSFYLDNISTSLINKSWAENDTEKGIYSLHVVYGGTNAVTYSINFNYRTGAFYAYDNLPFQSGVLAEDTANGKHMLACGYNGFIYHMDSGNLDVTTGVNDYYTSPFISNQSPSRVQKHQQVDMYFSPTSSGTIHIEDRTQFSSIWKLRQSFTVTNTESNHQIRQTIDVPETYNVYQFKVSSSANSANPWQLNLIDLAHHDVGIGKP